MATYTSSQGGNWSDPATWGGSGVPGAGDTAEIGAHSITVDVDTSIGLSANDATTKAITKTGTSGSFTIAAGVTLTIKGMFGFPNVSGGFPFVMLEGSSLIWDASSSGGTPVYAFSSAFFLALTINGSAASRCSVSAPVGYSGSFSVATLVSSIRYCDFARISQVLTTNGSGQNRVVENCTFTTCGRLNLASTLSGSTCSLIGNTFQGGTHATDDVYITMATTPAGSRVIERNSLSKSLLFVGKEFVCRNNFFGYKITCPGGQYFFRLFCGNFVNGVDADGQNINAVMALRNYFFTSGTVGNPHIVGPQLTDVDMEFSQCVFESCQPDLVDYGDCIELIDTKVTAGRSLIGNNNILLKNSSGAHVASGTLVSILSSKAIITKWHHNTVNVNNPSSGSLSRRAAFAVAESQVGTAGQVAAIKSNVVWGSAAGQGYISERLSGSVLDITAASGIDCNARFNTSAGNNGRGYNSTASDTALWTTGRAEDSGVDTHGIEADPQLSDTGRNLASWAVANGYAADVAGAMAYLAANPTKTTELVDWVFSGFRVLNHSLRSAGHDGATVGAANWINPLRSLAYITSERDRVAIKYGVAV